MNRRTDAGRSHQAAVERERGFHAVSKAQHFTAKKLARDLE
jgi:hypothetical protein